jgi:hypothetical protein
MNGHATGDDVAARNGSALVVVRIEDAVDPALTGRAGGVYESPPQPRERAMTLVRLLLGSVAEPPSGSERWVAPIAGGRRVVAINEVPVK